MNTKHKYSNSITLASTSGETGDTLMEVVWTQYYDTKEEQVKELQAVANGMIPKLLEVTYARADEMLKKRGQR